MKTKITLLSALLLSLPAYAAMPVNMDHLSPMQWAKPMSKAANSAQLKEVNRSTDFNNTLHVRIKQTYQGYPVWGADAVVHVPGMGKATQPWTDVVNKAATMNGVTYQSLSQDLANTPAYVFNAVQQKKMFVEAVKHYQGEVNRKVTAEEASAELMVYIDDQQKAHWAFLVRFLINNQAPTIPARPTYIIDATDSTIYQYWDDIKRLDKVDGGGLGGNHKVGKKIFDGVNAPKLQVMRDAEKKICYMKNDLVVIKDRRNNDKQMSYACDKPDAEHNNVYWHVNDDMVGTTFSPSNDALFGAKITYDMFMDWYHIPMLMKKDKPMVLPVIVHSPITNAYWDGSRVVFGDSVDGDNENRRFNPFTQLDTVGHEIAHGFTEQHSDLVYGGQSGGLNEAFSDMAGIAAEYYAYGHTDFLVGLGDMAVDGKAMRYMDRPSRDCEEDQTPGESCSIDDMSQYSSFTDVHYTSGIFNRVFYTLANSEGWDAKKAFDVMVQANMNYWTPTTTYAKAACGVIKAAGDYGYSVNQVIKAFKVVKIDVAPCFESKPH